MRALDLDFRRESLQSRWAGIALLVAGVAGAMAAGAHHVQLADEFAQLEASVRQSGAAARRQVAANPANGDLRKVALEVKRAGEVAVQLRLPWDDLFANVESANTADVALLSIESDTGKRALKITGEAKDLVSMLNYVRVLAGQPKLTNVYLQSHHLQQQDPQHPVRFALGANWVSGQ